MYYAGGQTRRRERKGFLPLLLITTLFLLCSGADGQIKGRPVSNSILQIQGVTVYENSNFGGRSKTLAVGNHKLSDFNDIASSIKVPQGLVAIIYENADDNGGYGIWVDLLEDQSDLSQFNFNDKTSYISVFSATREGGYIWARNSLRNGQFLSGHWERRRAGAAGNPVNSTPVVSPPLPAHVSSGATAIQISGGQFTITTLGAQISSDAALWQHAETDQMGVIGSDYRGREEIGSAAFERMSHNTLIPDNINFWYPQKRLGDRRGIVYFKQTLVGKIAGTVENDDEKDDNGKPVRESEAPKTANVNGTYEDHDVNIDVEPAADYMYLITDAHKPEKSVIQSLQLRGEHLDFPNNLSGAYNDPCTLPFKVVEAEIDMHPNAKKTLIEMAHARIGKLIGIYGAWIYDKGHCHHPEIHPAEQIWWRSDLGSDRKSYIFNVFCDASARFWWRSQMDDGTKLKPWGAPPIKATFAVAFEVELKPGKYFGKNFTVQDIDSYNVASVPGGNKIYNLVYQGNSLVSFDPKNDAFKVSFEKVGLKLGTGNIVRGFLVLETTVGSVTPIATKVGGIIGGVTIPQGTDPNDANKVPEGVEKEAFKKEEGQYMFTVRQTDMR